MNKLFKYYLWFMLLISSLCLVSFEYLMWTGRMEVNAGTLLCSLYPLFGVLVSLYLLINSKNQINQ